MDSSESSGVDSVIEIRVHPPISASESAHWSVCVALCLSMLSLGIWLLAFTTHYWAVGYNVTVGLYLVCQDARSPRDPSTCEPVIRDLTLWLTLGFMAFGVLCASVCFVCFILLVCKFQYRTKGLLRAAYITSYVASLCILAAVALFAYKLHSEDSRLHLSASWYLALCTDLLLFATSGSATVARLRWDVTAGYSPLTHSLNSEYSPLTQSITSQEP